MANCGKCVKCGKETELRCEKCKRSYYCSQECKLRGLNDGHEYICTPDFAEMLKLKFELEKTIRIPHESCWLSRSGSSFYVYDDDRRKFVRTVMVYKEPNVCVCCGNKVTYRGPLGDRVFRFKKDGVTVECYRCEECHDQNKTICPTTFQETQRCAKINHEKAIKFFLFIKQTEGDFNKLPKEIISVILRAFSKIKCH